MAGTKNIYNSEALDVVLEMIRFTYGIALDLTYADVVVTPLTSTTTQVSITPKSVNGYSLYTDPVSFVINKLNLSARIPKDMCYSGNWPADFASFSQFMLASYGLLIKAGQWEVVYGSTVYPLDGSVLINPDITSDRFLTLRPTAAHPLFVPAMAYSLMVTDPQNVAPSLTLSVSGDGDVNVGAPTQVQFNMTGGVGVTQFRIVSGESPLPLNQERTGLEGNYPVTGEYEFTVEARDVLGQTAEAIVQLNVQMDAVRIANSVPAVEVGQSINHTYNLQGGYQPLKIIKVTDLPLGMRLDINGVLTGRPDEGEHTFNFTVEDKLGIRTKIYDRLVVTERSFELAYADTLAASVRHLQAVNLSAETDWKISSTYSGQMISSTALKLQTGSIDTVFAEAFKELTVSFWLQAAQARPGGCIYSQTDGVNSLEIFVGDYDEHQLRLLLTVGGQQYGLMTRSEDRVVGDASTMITVGVSDGMLTLFVGTKPYDWVSTPVFSQLFAAGSKGRIGLTAGGLYQWTGTLEYFNVYKARLFEDQLV